MRELILKMSMSIDGFAGLPEPRIFKLLSSTTFPRGAVAQIYRPE